MTSLSQLPRVPLTAKDKAFLQEVTDLYEMAAKLYQENKNEPVDKRRYKVQAKANGLRAKAVSKLIMWAGKTLKEPAPGFPYGSNHPRLKKAYDASYNYRTWGNDGAAQRAASFLRSVIKRGWL